MTNHAPSGRAQSGRAQSGRELADLVGVAHDRLLPRVVEAVFGTTEPIAVATAITDAVSAALGAPVVDARFYVPGVGVVAGLDLADGRAVVAKVHRALVPVQRQRLTAIQRVQADVARAGLPAPMPLAGPVPVADGWLMVEELRPGTFADGTRPEVRRGMAAALHDLVVAARHHATDGWIGGWLGPPEIDGLWPTPHDLRFDFLATSGGAEWIDATARHARAVLSSTRAPVVVGHFDYRIGNLGFEGDGVCAIYDWDSLGLAPEAAIVGAASVCHPINWWLAQPDPVPTPEQVDAFVADYETARGTPFDAGEQELLVAGQRWCLSFGARCQHSDHVLEGRADADPSRRWPRLLRELLDR